MSDAGVLPAEIRERVKIHPAADLFPMMSDAPIADIRVVARNEWQVRALAAEPTTPEEAAARYNALSWEIGEIELRHRALKEAQGKVLEDAKRLFPGGRGWKAWLKSHRTCEMSSAALTDALDQVGRRPDGRPHNTATQLTRFYNGLVDNDDPRLDRVTAAFEQLLAEFSSNHPNDDDPPPAAKASAA